MGIWPNKLSALVLEPLDIRSEEYVHGGAFGGMEACKWGGDMEGRGGEDIGVGVSSCGCNVDVGKL